jgi:hypothetical protein
MISRAAGFSTSLITALDGVAAMRAFCLIEHQSGPNGSGEARKSRKSETIAPDALRVGNRASWRTGEGVGEPCNH